MTMFRACGLQIIDRAHNAIACAEMAVMHSFTDEDKAKHGAALFQAQRFLARACETWRDWQARADTADDDEPYPHVPETDEEPLL